MNDMNTASGTAAPQRPTLLTVICILSFIAGAWGVISGVINLAGGSEKQAAALAEAQQQLEDTKAQMGDQAAGMMGGMMDQAMEMAQKAADNARPMAIASIVLALISLFGVWKMWNLQKAGFWLYLVAAIGGLIMPLVFLGASMMAIMSVGVAGLFSVIFIILYAVNLKYMH